MVTIIYKTGSEIWGPFPPPKGWRSENIKIWDKFRTTRQLDREYLRNETRYRRTENSVANCNLFCACTLNLVNFGPQTAKNRTGDSTDLTRLRCVGHVS